MSAPRKVNGVRKITALKLCGPPNVSMFAVLSVVIYLTIGYKDAQGEAESEICSTLTPRANDFSVSHRLNLKIGYDGAPGLVETNERYLHPTDVRFQAIPI